MYLSSDSRSWNQTTCSSCPPVQDPCSSSNSASYQLVVETVCAACQTLSRVRSIDKLTGASISPDQFYDSGGNIITAPASFLPGGCQTQQVTAYYKATVASTGIAAGDVLSQVRTLCLPGNTLLSETWFNTSQSGAAILKPATGTVVFLPDGAQSTSLYREFLTGTASGLNGVNTSFVTQQRYQPGTLIVSLDGQELAPLGDYTENAPTGFTLADAPASDQIIIVKYALENTDGKPFIPVYLPGNGLIQSGTTFAVKPASSRITSTSTGIDLATSGVVAGTYQGSVLTVDAYGRVIQVTAPTPTAYLATYKAAANLTTL